MAVRAIRAEHGAVNARLVVEHAQDQDSPFRPDVYNCDDGVAAVRYREFQARLVLRSIVIMPEIDRGESFPEVRLLHALDFDPAERPECPFVVPADGQEPDEEVVLASRNYEDVFDLARAPDKWTQLLIAAHKDLDAMLDKYQNLEGFGGISQAVRDFMERNPVPGE